MNNRIERAERIEKVNELIRTIGSCGRRFFSSTADIPNPKTDVEVIYSYIKADHRGRLWYVDCYKGRETYLHYSGEWRKFHNGGTLRRLIEALRDYITTGEPLKKGHFYFPKWTCDGDVWGYGKDMETVRRKAIELEIIRSTISSDQKESKS